MNMSPWISFDNLYVDLSTPLCSTTRYFGAIEDLSDFAKNKLVSKPSLSH